MIQKLYIGTYTHTSDSHGLYYVAVDTEKKTVETLQVVSMVGPSFLIYSPDRRYMYAVQEHDGKRSLSSFSVDKDGYLTFLNTASTPGADICHTAVAPDASFLTGSSYTHGYVVTISLNEDGTLGDIVSLDQHEGHGPAPEQDIPRAHCAVFDKTARYIVAADYGNDIVYVYRHSAGGKLHEVHRYSVTPGFAPRMATFSDDNRNLYVITQNGNMVIHYKFDEVQGTLNQKASYTCLPEGFKGKSEAAEVQFSPDGAYVYASSRGSDTIACYKYNVDGTLRPEGIFACGGEFPRHFTISKDGRYLYCGNQNSHTLTVLDRDPASGALSEVPIIVHKVGSPTFVLLAESYV